jgi:hypothetical protein
MGRAKSRGRGKGSGAAGVQRKKPPYNLKTRIIGQLRRLFMWHPGLKVVKERQRVAYGRYQCECCQCVFGPKEMRMDHVEPVVPIEGFTDWSTYISRMFDVIPDGIQYICQDCHYIKTQAERIKRSERKRLMKSEVS